MALHIVASAAGYLGGRRESRKAEEAVPEDPELVEVAGFKSKAERKPGEDELLQVVVRLADIATDIHRGDEAHADVKEIFPVNHDTDVYHIVIAAGKLHRLRRKRTVARHTDEEDSFLENRDAEDGFRKRIGDTLTNCPYRRVIVIVLEYRQHLRQVNRLSGGVRVLIMIKLYRLDIHVRIDGQILNRTIHDERIVRIVDPQFVECYHTAFILSKNKKKRSADYGRNSFCYRFKLTYFTRCNSDV